jgi:transketolase C-terminal domain/subunit
MRAEGEHVVVVVFKCPDARQRLMPHFVCSEATVVALPIGLAAGGSEHVVVAIGNCLRRDPDFIEDTVGRTAKEAGLASDSRRRVTEDNSKSVMRCFHYL